MSRLSYTPSPERNIIEQSVQGKENPAKKVVVNRKCCTEVKELRSEGGKQDSKSVQRSKRPTRKGTNKSVQGKEKLADKAVNNRKPDEKRDSHELAPNSKSKLSCQTDNNNVNTATEMTSLDIETPPTARSSPKQFCAWELVEENADDQTICPCPFECGIEPCKLPVMRNHIIVNHSEQSGDNKSGEASFEEDNIIRKAFMLSTKGLLTCYKFNKLLRDNNFHEVIVPGNGYCYVSALLITLAEQGVNKEMAVLALEVMTEIKNHTRFYRNFNDSASEEEFLTSCSDFFQRGSYSTEVVDVCIGATANALGVNLNIVQKNQKTVSLTRYDCNRYKSRINLFLLFIPPTTKRKSLDAHYNCYVNQDFFKHNKVAISSLIVKPVEDNQPEAESPTSAENVSHSSIENSKT